MGLGHVCARGVRFYGTLSIAGGPAAGPTYGLAMRVDYSFRAFPQWLTVELLSEQAGEFLGFFQKMVYLFLPWAVWAEVTWVTAIPTLPVVREARTKFGIFPWISNFWFPSS